ncbi:uncharacterized protein MYCGRDRAFT_97938 [Zymoseptoria tritici IPO323]|uniref:Uncharacterized protein n=1 Tax=Zymoseptoria tritici (strain CBS 115943 / IPO323) TaxID=336722 RepID=F9XRU5_ZYMTI|nr:uncharacterized protein MYCGRDRAFT_97938 [Zymoseptoria tritici IPO323]EGP81976.1 hypothetical protein MYCGRDRAFT_97938 [Zymoseptoria tritici IPO323]
MSEYLALCECVTANEDLGNHGVESAEEMWNITLIILQSSSASCAAMQKAAHGASQIQSLAVRSIVCRNARTYTLPWPMTTSNHPSPLMLLNYQLSQFNSTVAALATLQSSLLPQLADSTNLFGVRFASFTSALTKHKLNQQRGQDVYRYF